MSAEQEIGLSFLFDKAYQYQPEFNMYVSQYVQLLKLDNPSMDETQMSMAQQTLKVEFYRQCLESLGTASFDCLLIMDTKGVLLETNQVAEKTLGIKRQEVLGQPFLEKLFPSHQIDEYVEWIKKHAKDDDSVYRKSTEVTMLKANGSMFPAELKVNEFHIFGSSLWVVCFNDITRKKWLDQALKYTEERYRKIMGENADAIFLIDPYNKRIEESNPAFNIMLGYNDDELFALRLYDVMEGDRDEIDDWVDKRMRKGTSVLFREQGKFINRAAHQIEVEFTASVFDLRDHPILCIIVRDTAAREMVVTRTLADDQLKAMTKRLKKMEERLVEMQQTKVNRIQQEILDELMESHTELKAELQRDKDRGPSDPWPMGLVKQPFELKTILFEIQSTFKKQLAEKEVPLVIDVDPEMPDVFIGDPLKIHEILHHIVDNAVNHTQEGDIMVRIRPTDVERSQVTVLFTIRDSGDGIPLVTKAKVKDVLSDEDPFETGMRYNVRGMAICAKYAQRMGGKIWFNTIEGKGSSFLFSVPLEYTELDPEDIPPLSMKDVQAHLDYFDSAQEQDDEEDGGDAFTMVDEDAPAAQAPQKSKKTKKEPQPKKSSKKAKTSKKGKKSKASAEDLNATLDGKRILLVESDLENAITLQSVLKEYNIDLRMVDNGRKALEVVQETPSDYIATIMRLDLPVMDGGAAAAKIRELEQKESIEEQLMIALGNESELSDYQDALDAFSKVLESPLSEEDIQELLVWIYEQLTGVVQEEPEAEPEAEPEQAPQPESDPEPEQKPKPAAEEVPSEPEPAPASSGNGNGNAYQVVLSADMAKLAPNFLEKRRKDVDKIRAAVGEQNYEGVRVLGKSMKGTGAVYGFEQIAEIGKELESAASESSSDGVNEWLAKLESFLNQVQIVAE